MKWIKLANFESDFIPRGYCLRFPAGESFESHVIMMVCEGHGNHQEKGLMVISGHKAGINLYQIFPTEELTGGTLEKKWLIENWNKWVWPFGSVDETMISTPIEAEKMQSPFRLEEWRTRVAKQYQGQIAYKPMGKIGGRLHRVKPQTGVF